MKFLENLTDKQKGFILGALAYFVVEGIIIHTETIFSVYEYRKTLDEGKTIMKNYSKQMEKDSELMKEQNKMVHEFAKNIKDSTKNIIDSAKK